MSVIISMLRGVNVGGNHRIKMDALRSLYESLGLLYVQTYVQSGNVVFKVKGHNLGSLAAKIEQAIEQSFGFRSGVILRSASELRDAIAKNPFANRPNIDPSRLLLTFLHAAPTPQALGNALALPAFPEELRIDGREAYIYYPNGMARPKLQWPRVEKALITWGTGRNWNTVTKLLEMAEELEGRSSQ